MTTFTDLLAIFEERGWSVHYQNMREGKWGHYLTVGYLENPFHSFHKFTVLEAETFPKLITTGP